MVRRLVALCTFGIAVAVSAQQPPPPPPPARPAPQTAPAQGGRAAGSGPVVLGGAGPLLTEAPRIVGTGAISGVVTDGSTGAPIEGAIVGLSGSSSVVGQIAASWPRQVTDSKGRFVFIDLPAASYSLGASRPGYLSGGYRRVPGMDASTQVSIQLSLAEGQWFTEGHIKLWKPAAISGTVRDERGEPFVGVRVRMLMGTTVAGRERWASGPVTETDDRGMYRFAGLSTGRYLIHVPSIQVSLPSGEVALYRYPYAQGGNVLHVVRGPDDSGVIAGLFPSAPADEKGSVYRSVFHAAARSLNQAEPIALTFGDDRKGIDIEMVPLPSVSVSGTVAGPPDSVGGLPVRILAAGNESLGLAGDTGVTKTDANGRFTFHQIPAGDYVIIVSRSVADYQVWGFVAQQETLVPAGANPFGLRLSNMGGSNGMVLNGALMPGGKDVTGRLEVSVGNRSVSGLVVPVTPTVPVSGHLEWDGAEVPPSGAPIPPVVRLEPADGDVTLGVYFCNTPRPLPDDPPARITFTCENVKAGRYVLANWTFGRTTHRLVGATWNGRDIIESPLEVSGDGPVTGIVLRMSSQMNKVTGTVRGPDGRVASDGTVIAFPVSQAAWREAGVTTIRFHSANVGADGTYELTSILPGDYLLAAVAMEDRNRGTEPAFLASIAGRATRVTLGLSSTLSQELRVIAGAR